MGSGKESHHPYIATQLDNNLSGLLTQADREQLAKERAGQQVDLTEEEDRLFHEQEQEDEDISPPVQDGTKQGGFGKLVFKKSSNVPPNVYSEDLSTLIEQVQGDLRSVSVAHSLDNVSDLVSRLANVHFSQLRADAHRALFEANEQAGRLYSRCMGLEGRVKQLQEKGTSSVYNSDEVDKLVTRARAYKEAYEREKEKNRDLREQATRMANRIEELERAQERPIPLHDKPIEKKVFINLSQN